MSNTYVTKVFLPPKTEYFAKIQQIYESGTVTNQGPMVRELENELTTFLNVKKLHYVTNGTIALQLALHALDVTEGEIITTPFSYVATTSSILWERCTPVFVDIEPDNFTLDPQKIEAAITGKTKAIMPVHVFGYACKVKEIAEIAQKYDLKVIYDAAHAFGASYQGKSLCSYGDISTLSFHATKIFHTIEGGACIVNDEDVSNKLDLSLRFGHDRDEHFSLGINGKQSEMHAAMGLCHLPYFRERVEKRKSIHNTYVDMLGNSVQLPKMQEGLEYNYAYFPVVFSSEKELLHVFNALKEKNIFPRRYFYPSLNTLPYLKNAYSCPISEDISNRIACLPFYADLEMEKVEEICEIIKGNI